MKRYLILLCVIALSLSVLSAQVAAKIGSRAYSAKEIKESFAAYQEFHKNQNAVQGADDAILLEQFFDEMIAKYIYDHEVARRGIAPTTAELLSELRKRPPGIAIANKSLYSDDNFDFEKYEKELESNAAFRDELIASISDTFSYKKLLDEIRDEYVPDRELIKKQWLSMGNLSEARIIHFLPQEPEVSTSIEDARLLYEANKDEYKREDGRSLRYVAFEGGSSRRRVMEGMSSEEDEAKARELWNLSVKKGLSKAAKELGYTLQETPPFSIDDAIIRGIGRDMKLVLKVFQSLPGALLGVHKSDLGGIYVLEVAQVHDTYYIPFEIERDLLMLKAAYLKKQELREAEIVDFITERSSAEYFEEARARGYEIFEQIDITKESRFGKHGAVPSLNQAILSTFESDFTPLIEENGQYFIALVNRHYVRNEAVWRLAGDEIIRQVSSIERQRHLDDWYQNQKDGLELVYPAASLIQK